MSCFICCNDTFKSVTKVCFLYGLRQRERGEYPLTLQELDDFIGKVVTVNAKNYSIRYNEEVEVEADLFDDIPDFKIEPQDLKSTLCWLYNSEDYMENDKTFMMVKDAYEWAKMVTDFTKDEMDNARWH